MRYDMPHDNLSFLQRLVEYGAFGYVWLLFISIWGGTVRYIYDLKRGNKPSFINWLYEACISGFVGIITAMSCQYYEIDFLLTSAITGMAAHNGTRTLFLIAKAIQKNTGTSFIGNSEQSAQPSSAMQMKSNEEGKKCQK